ncbi:MAG: hypothetical protein II825_00055 [Paludibacteraceae bacterium]|nr:hypothetical protein [Paludibacteraceae bacterium]
MKSIIIARLEDRGMCFTSLPSDATPHTRGVRYFHPARGIEIIQGAMDHYEEGQKYKKRIVVRPSRFRKGLHELYTYHFPTHWSAACVANREMIKEAQRQAHALEHDHSIEALEWRVRFFNHYFTVFKGGAKPEPGLKPYSRFYQYTYVAIYRQLQSERQKAQEGINLEDLNFEAIDMDRPFVLKRRAAMANTNTLKILQINLHIPKKSSTFADVYG